MEKGEASDSVLPVQAGEQCHGYILSLIDDTDVKLLPVEAGGCVYRYRERQQPILLLLELVKKGSCRV